MFGFNTSQTSTTSKGRAGDEGDTFVLSFEPYPEMSPPRLAGEWREGEPKWADDTWADDIWPDDIDESDPQPGFDDHDYDD